MEEVLSKEVHCLLLRVKGKEKLEKGTTRPHQCIFYVAAFSSL